MWSFNDWVENIVGKGDARFQHFLLSQECFQKAFSLWMLKAEIAWKDLNFTTQSRLLTTLKKKNSKKLREKEKMLVTSIFPFSHNVFYAPRTSFNFSATFILSSANCFQFELF